VEASVNIFEVLTAVALLIVVVLMGVVLVYIIKILGLLHRVMTSAETGFDVLKSELHEVIEHEKRDRTGTMSAAVILLGFLWRMFRKDKSSRSSKRDTKKEERE